MTYETYVKDGYGKALVERKRQCRDDGVTAGSGYEGSGALLVHAFLARDRVCSRPRAG
jgi:hypothetical protein